MKTFEERKIEIFSWPQNQLERAKGCIYFMSGWFLNVKIEQLAHPHGKFWKT